MDELDPVKGRMEYRSTDFNEDFNDGKGHILDNIFDQSEADHGNSLLNSEQSIFQMNGKPEENSRQHEGVDVFSNSYSGAPNFSSRSSMQDENDTQDLQSEDDSDVDSNGDSNASISHSDISSMTTNFLHPKSAYGTQFHSGSPSLCDSRGSTPEPGKLGRRRKHEMSEEDATDPVKVELHAARRLLREIMHNNHKTVNWAFLDPVDTDALGLDDYHEKIKQPMWLNKMKDKFDNNEYKSMTEFVADFRLMLENCYRYNGPDHGISKKALRLETIMEQKLALLPKELREKTSVAATLGEPVREKQLGSRKKKDLMRHDSSSLLEELRAQNKQKEREQRYKAILHKRSETEQFVHSLDEWETSLTGGLSGKEYVNKLWELPCIGLFLYLAGEALNTGEVQQWELEHCMFMARESSTLGRVMTSLLSTPQQRVNLDKKPTMPYYVWESKLRIRVRTWYKTFRDCAKLPSLAANKIGIEERFFAVCGPKNPLEKNRFHELTFYQKVWMLKALCEWCVEHQEAVRDAIEQNPVEDQTEYLLGTDTEGYRYLNFPQFCGPDLRIYKQPPLPFDPWKPEILAESPPQPKLSKKRFAKAKKPKDQAWGGETTTKRKKKSKDEAQDISPRSRDGRLRQRPRQFQASVVEASGSSDDDEILRVMQDAESSTADDDEASVVSKKSTPSSSRRSQESSRKRKAEPTTPRQSTRQSNRSARLAARNNRKSDGVTDEELKLIEAMQNKDDTSEPVADADVTRKVLPNTSTVKDEPEDVKPLVNDLVKLEDVKQEEDNVDVNGDDKIFVKHEFDPATSVSNCDIETASNGTVDYDVKVQNVEDVASEIAATNDSDFTVKQEAEDPDQDTLSQCPSLSDVITGVAKKEKGLDDGDLSDVTVAYTDSDGEVNDPKKPQNNVTASDYTQEEDEESKKVDSEALKAARERKLQDDVRFVMRNLVYLVEEKIEDELVFDPPEPEYDGFEMICDSVYDLSQLLQRFSPPTEDQGEDNNDTPEQLECEQELYTNLKSIYDELNQWDSKLQKSKQKAQLKMRKELETFIEPLHMDVQHDDLWSNESDDEAAKQLKPQAPPVDQTEVQADLEHLHTRSGRRLKKKFEWTGGSYEEEPEEEEEVDEEMFDISSRGRIRKRRFNLEGVKAKDDELQNKKKKPEPEPKHRGKPQMAGRSYPPSYDFKEKERQKNMLAQSKTILSHLQQGSNQVQATKTAVNSVSAVSTSPTASTASGASTSQGTIIGVDLNAKVGLLRNARGGIQLVHLPPPLLAQLAQNKNLAKCVSRASVAKQQQQPATTQQEKSTTDYIKALLQRPNEDNNPPVTIASSPSSAAVVASVTSSPIQSPPQQLSVNSVNNSRMLLLSPSKNPSTVSRGLTLPSTPNVIQSNQKINQSTVQQVLAAQAQKQSLVQLDATKQRDGIAAATGTVLRIQGSQVIQQRNMLPKQQVVAVSPAQLSSIQQLSQVRSVGPQAGQVVTSSPGGQQLSIQAVATAAQQLSSMSATPAVKTYGGQHILTLGNQHVIRHQPAAQLTSTQLPNTRQPLTAAQVVRTATLNKDVGQQIVIQQSQQQQQAVIGQQQITLQGHLAGVAQQPQQMQTQPQQTLQLVGGQNQTQQLTIQGQQLTVQGQPIAAAQNQQLLQGLAGQLGNQVRLVQPARLQLVQQGSQLTLVPVQDQPAAASSTPALQQTAAVQVLSPPQQTQPPVVDRPQATQCTTLTSQTTPPKRAVPPLQVVQVVGAAGGVQQVLQLPAGSQLLSPSNAQQLLKQKEQLLSNSSKSLEDVGKYSGATTVKELILQRDKTLEDQGTKLPTSTVVTQVSPLSVRRDVSKQVVIKAAGASDGKVVQVSLDQYQNIKDNVLKRQKEAALENAVRTVVTSVKTTIPTMQYQFSTTETLDASKASTRRPVTSTSFAIKAPISTVDPPETSLSSPTLKLGNSVLTSPGVSKTIATAVEQSPAASTPESGGSMAPVSSLKIANIQLPSSLTKSDALTHPVVQRFLQANQGRQVLLNINGTLMTSSGAEVTMVANASNNAMKLVPKKTVKETTTSPVKMVQQVLTPGPSNRTLSNASVNGASLGLLANVAASQHRQK